MRSSRGAVWARGVRKSDHDLKLFVGHGLLALLASARVHRVSRTRGNPATCVCLSWQSAHLSTAYRLLFTMEYSFLNSARSRYPLPSCAVSATSDASQAHTLRGPRTRAHAPTPGKTPGPGAVGDAHHIVCVSDSIEVIHVNIESELVDEVTHLYRRWGWVRAQQSRPSSWRLGATSTPCQTQIRVVGASCGPPAHLSLGDTLVMVHVASLEHAFLRA